MFNSVLAVTNRHLCPNTFLEQIRNVVSLHPAALLLREKDLPQIEYKTLAESILQICEDAGTPCILHTFDQVARTLHCASIHLPLSYLENHPSAIEGFETVGVSVHSLKQAQRAVSLGATYLVAGHIFPTACKPDLPARGLAFLQTVCQAVSIPVYAIGGVTPQNAPQCMQAGAHGVAVMSGMMQRLSDWNTGLPNHLIL